MHLGRHMRWIKRWMQLRCGHDNTIEAPAECYQDVGTINGASVALDALSWQVFPLTRHGPHQRIYMLTCAARPTVSTLGETYSLSF